MLFCNEKLDLIVGLKDIQIILRFDMANLINMQFIKGKKFYQI